ncbi:DNA helicase-2 / ATP-dependent DNA helicase PcrA [Kytococcus aerolatus]|uniref:DNA 3'-5' helicase n=1 Tax=Kytococcus aerolatus TaxID=592308 RepID=A0A212T834_9MICO|nr:UvrD-helicase domain-containing protein [Kytococcus aerolatus]SNC61976.1 DNA helicase-2 / ATP-dependent DNA helicase PcrA [Kytococcus aerolatus]
MIRHSAADLARVLGQHPPTPEQAAVIECTDPAQLVVAGAGSGKTETMAARVVWLVANELVRPEQVLGLTFTRKAAAELSERLGARLATLQAAGILPDEALEAPVVSTYNAWSGGIVAEHGLRLGVEPGARVLSAVESWQGVTDLVTRWPDDLPAEVGSLETVVEGVLTLSGQMGDHLVEGEQVLAELDRVEAALGTVAGKKDGSEYAEVTRARAVLAARRALVPLAVDWARTKAEQGVLDFSDQTRLSARLAREHAVVGRVERARSRAVLLDEFQDTTEAQLSVVRSVFAGHPALSVTAVGDPHQAIYGFRGASARTMESFVESFGAVQRSLSTSWRNAAGVLAVANRIAEPLREGSTLDLPVLRPRPGEGSDAGVEAARLGTLDEEAAAVAAWLRRHWSPGRTSAAVLCRKRAQFPRMVSALEEAGIPHEVVGLGGLLQLPEVADVRALLTVVADPARGDRLMRLLTGPAVRLGAADLVALDTWRRELGRRWSVPRAADGPAGRQDARAMEVTLLDAVCTPPPDGWTGLDGVRLTDTARRRLARLAEAVDRCRAGAHLPVDELAVLAEEALGVHAELAARPDSDPAHARAHLEALHHHVATYAETSERASLAGLLRWFDTAEQQDGALEPGAVEVDPDAVQIMTVHASKGLEWDAVALPGWVAGTFPSGTGTPRPQDGEWVGGEATDSGWWGPTSGELPYALRGDVAALPGWRLPADPTHTDLKEVQAGFRRAVGTRGVQEERRLAYVAVTRARSRVLLAASTWGTGSRPTPTSDFLTECLDLVERGRWEPMPPVDPAPENPVLAVPVQVRWPRPVEEDGLARAVAAATAEMATALATPPGQETGWAGVDEAAQQELRRFRQDTRLLLAERDHVEEAAGLDLRHLATSSLVALARDPGFLRALRRPVPTPPATSARRGTAFHAWLEDRWAGQRLFDELDDDRWARAEGELPVGELGEVVEDDAFDLAHLQQTFLASSWADRVPAFVELPLQTTVAGLTIRGRADAVFPADAAERARGLEWVVVDWKTSRAPTGAAARAAAVQLACYVEAFARWQGVDRDRVGGAFYHAADGRTLRPELPTGEALEQLVERVMHG